MNCNCFPADSSGVVVFQWPKFANAVFGTNQTAGFEGVVVGMWAPAAATTPFGEISVETEYPFGDNATVTVTGGGGKYLYLRVPSWAVSARIAPQWGPHDTGE